MRSLDALPRLGWVAGPTPVDEAPGLAGALGLAWVGIKRDDTVPMLAGGSKVRKLDLLLAAPPFAEAPAWAGAGGIGSGQLVALGAAARALGRALDAHVFWTPLDAWVRENLAATASTATRLGFHRNRVALAMTEPALVGVGRGRVPVVLPGASMPLGMAGMALAGLELAAQVAGGLVAPARIYLPLGTGGSAVGLAYGLGLAGLRCEVHAVGVVERALSPRRRLDSLHAQLVALLGEVEPAPIVVRRGQLGRGYGLATEAARDAVDRLAAVGVVAETTYGGKAFAQLVADAQAGWRGPALFWHTARGPLPPPAPDWELRLPPVLRARLAPSSGISRRAVLAGAGAAAALLAGARVASTPPTEGFDGAVLGPREATILHAVAEAVLPDGADVARVAANVDRYLVGLPPASLREISALLLAIEHTTGLARFGARPVAERRAALEALDARGGLFRVMARGVRDLALLGWWQEDETWPAIGYDGPLVPNERRPTEYDALRAPPGTRPKGAA